MCNHATQTTTGHHCQGAVYRASQAKGSKTHAAHSQTENLGRERHECGTGTITTLVKAIMRSLSQVHKEKPIIFLVPSFCWYMQLPTKQQLRMTTHTTLPNHTHTTANPRHALAAASSACSCDSMHASNLQKPAPPCQHRHTGLIHSHVAQCRRSNQACRAFSDGIRARLVTTRSRTRLKKARSTEHGL